MDKYLKTTHINYVSMFYFTLSEKIGAIVFSFWIVLLVSLFYFISKHHFGGEVPLLVVLSLIFMLMFGFVVVTVFHLIPSYCRGKFLRKGGYCSITPEYIESICDGEIKVYEYKNRSIKTKKHKDGSADIFIGKSLIDVLKHGPVIFTPANVKAWKAAMGIGAPLYRITNADEVIRYLEANK